MMITFKNPASSPRKGPPAVMDDETIAALCERSGEWAIVKTYDAHGTAYAAASRIRTGKAAAAIVAHQWETTVRPNETGEGHDLYARHIACNPAKDA